MGRKAREDDSTTELKKAVKAIGQALKKGGEEGRKNH
jgi:hypothetical protein